jgi:oxygen-dependent protoporphyrinogen oxidase
VHAIENELRGAVRTGSRAVGLARADTGWEINFADGSRDEADGIVLSVPAYEAANLLRPLEPQLADLLEHIRYNSIATINIAYDAAAAPKLPRTTGFVVPYGERHHITAATIVTQKYPNRAPRDTVLLRAFIGGALQAALLEFDDERLVEMAREEFARLLGIRAEPRFVAVRRWTRLLPEYGLGHKSLIDTIQQRAASLKGTALAGSAYYGVGIPDCIHSGERAAAQLLGTMYRA